MRSYSFVAAWLASALVSSRVTGAASVDQCLERGLAAPNQTLLTDVHPTYLEVPGWPFGLTYAHEDDIAFVSSGFILGVLDTSTTPPTLRHQIPLPEPFLGRNGGLGVTLTHDGRHVLVTGGPGLVVVNVHRAVAGRSDAVVGTINGTTAAQQPGTGAIQVTLTPDDAYAFVSQEYGPPDFRGRGSVDVFKLHKPTANGTVMGEVVGFVTLDYSVVGTSLSADGRHLYALSEVANASATAPGVVSILDVHALKHDPGTALRGNVTAGCGPVRTLVSSDGKVLWVTARESNQLLAFDTAKLLACPADALLATVQVGTAPVGLTFVRNETRILTADSNRFNDTGTTSGLSVVDVRAALAGEQAVLGRVSTFSSRSFPREFAVSNDGSTVLVADYYDHQVQAVVVDSLP